MSNKSFSSKSYNEACAMNDALDVAHIALVALHDEASAMNDAFNSQHQALELVSVTDSVESDADSVETLDSYMSRLSRAVDVRRAYEIEKNAESDSILAKLKSFKASVSHDRIASIMQASNVDANLLNRQERINARFNEKSYVKVLNIARAIARVETLNIYTRAILASVKAFEDNDMLMTQSETKLACSASARASDTRRNSALIRTAKIYGASTCSTQASSTNNALQAYDVLIETRDAANNVCFKLNRENDATKALLALI